MREDFRCGRCGECCKYAVVYYLKKDFDDDTKKWAQMRGLQFIELDEDWIGALTENRCPHLIGEEQSKYTCDIYDTDKLPEICRKKPGAQHLRLLPRCYYNIQLIEEFTKGENHG